MAVATPKELVIPVIRNAESSRFLNIEKEIAGLGNLEESMETELGWRWFVLMVIFIGEGSRWNIYHVS